MVPDANTAARWTWCIPRCRVADVYPVELPAHRLLEDSPAAPGAGGQPVLRLVGRVRRVDRVPSQMTPVSDDSGSVPPAACSQWWPALAGRVHRVLPDVGLAADDRAVSGAAAPEASLIRR